MKKIIAAVAVSCVLVCSIIVPAFAMEWDDSYESVCEHMEDAFATGDYSYLYAFYSGSDHYVYCDQCCKIALFSHDFYHTGADCLICSSFGACDCLDDYTAEDLGLVLPDNPDVPYVPGGADISDGSSSPVSAIGSVFTAAMDWVKTTASVIAHNPILLVACVAVPLCSLGVGMFIRIKSKSKVRS